MKHVIIGTAGHVDHGKTQLVKALTGKDTDRLKEEKERGISIELGFAPFVLPSGRKVAIIDVPGHEKFIKNMLAGVGGIDLVLLVIAADEGVMPQTQEHLDIIQLLQIPRGIIVITKTDLVDEDWLQLVMEEVRERVKETVLAHAPMVGVSSFTGKGVPKLLDYVEEAVNQIQPRSKLGRFRMPVDRVFSITGFGTVVTGTLTSGHLNVGDVVQVLPENLEARVRTLQVYSEKVERADAGQRVAVNLTGLEVQDLNRGSVLAQPDTLHPSYRLDVKLTLLPSVEKNLENRQRIRLHIGTTESLGRITLLDRDELEPGQETFAQLIMEEPIVAAKHDRFVIRSYSPMHTIGGGQVIDPNPAKHKRFKQEILASLATKLQGTSDELLIQQLAGIPDQLVSLVDLASQIGMELSEAKKAQQLLADTKQLHIIPADNKEFLVAENVYARWVHNVVKATEEYHNLYPLRAGIPKEEIRSRFFKAIPNKVFNFLIQYWVQQQILDSSEQIIAINGFEPQIEPSTQDIIERVLEILASEPFQPQAWSEIVEQLQIPNPLKDELILYLVTQGLLIKVDEDMYFTKGAIEQAKGIITAYLKENKELQLGAARDILQSSRKYVLPLLEYFDHQRLTRRVGDKRVLA